MNYYEQAWAAIKAVHEGLPDDTSFLDRMSAIDAAYPFGRRALFPYRAWLKARNEYKIPFMEIENVT